MEKLLLKNLFSITGKKSFKDIFKYKIIILTIKSAHQGCIYLIENTEIEQQYY